MAKNICPKCKVENVNDAVFCDNCGETLNNSENTQNNQSGQWWGVLNSWWILLTFTLSFLNWVSFLYVGFTAKQRKWMIWGVIYALPLLSAIIVGGINVSAITGIWVLFFIIMGIASIIHAFIIRKEYLIRLEIVKKLKQENKVNKEEDMRKKIEEEYKIGKKGNID